MVDPKSTPFPNYAVSLAAICIRAEPVNSLRVAARMGCAAPEHAQLVGLWMEMGIIIIKGRCSMYILASAAVHQVRVSGLKIPADMR